MSTNFPKNFSDKIDFSGNCWIWTAYKNRQGYGTYREGKVKRAHRCSWKYTHGEVPEGLRVLHKCDNPSCVNPDHLFLGTQQDNMDDMKEKGRSPFQAGERNNQAKLTKEQVDEIRRTYKRGYRCSPSDHSLGMLAEKYRVSDSQISKIVKRQSWD